MVVEQKDPYWHASQFAKLSRAGVRGVASWQNGRVPFHAIGDSGQLQALLEGVIAIDSEVELPAILRRIAETACSLTGARYGALSLLASSGNGGGEFVSVGMDQKTVDAIGQLPNEVGILGQLVTDPKPLRLADLSAHPDPTGFPPAHPPMRTFLGVPLRVRDEILGSLYVAEKGGSQEFTETDEALVVTLAGAVGIAMDHARLQTRLGELNVAADRERIARDLHDTVIQRLFVTGLSLQSKLTLIHDPEARSCVEDAILDLDDTIRQVRTTIFALDPPIAAEKGVRARVLEICTKAAGSLGFEPEVRFVGAIDRFVSASVGDELLSTLREALTNAARHAEARHIVVELIVGEEVYLRVMDDGVGVENDRHGAGRGLSNMAERAQTLKGSFTLKAGLDGGTEVSWRVPLAP
jgi:signal transduction histidine kinase